MSILCAGCQKDDGGWTIAAAYCLLASDLYRPIAAAHMAWACNMRLMSTWGRFSTAVYEQEKRDVRWRSGGQIEYKKRDTDLQHGITEARIRIALSIERLGGWTKGGLRQM